MMQRGTSELVLFVIQTTIMNNKIGGCPSNHIALSAWTAAAGSRRKLDNLDEEEER